MTIDDARVGVLQQRQIGGQIQRSADDDRERIGLEAGPLALLAAPRVGHDAPVALDAQRAGADHHGVDAGAQGVEQLAVGDAGDRRRAPRDRGPAVARVHHVQRRYAGARRGELPRRAAPRRARRRSARRRSGSSRRRATGGSLRAARHVIGWPGSMASLTAWKSASSPAARRSPRTARAGSRRGRRGRGARRSSPANQLGQPSRIGTPRGPGCQAQRSNLSISSPVWPPNSCARSRLRAGDEMHGERVDDAARGGRSGSRARGRPESAAGRAALRREADHAPFTPLGVGGRDDEQRVIQRSRELEERGGRVAHRHGSHATRCGMAKTAGSVRGAWQNGSSALTLAARRSLSRCSTAGAARARRCSRPTRAAPRRSSPSSSTPSAAAGAAAAVGVAVPRSSTGRRAGSAPR